MDFRFLVFYSYEQILYVIYEDDYFLSYVEGEERVGALRIQSGRGSES